MGGWSVTLPPPSPVVLSCQVNPPPPTGVCTSCVCVCVCGWVGVCTLKCRGHPHVYLQGLSHVHPKMPCVAQFFGESTPVWTPWTN